MSCLEAGKWGPAPLLDASVPSPGSMGTVCILPGFWHFRHSQTSKNLSNSRL